MGFLSLLVVAATSVFQMPSEAMEPTIPIGGRVVATLGAYDADPVVVGDIVLMHPPAAVDADELDAMCGDSAREAGAMCAQMRPGLLTDVTWMKRVVGLPGDQLSMSHGRLVRNGVAVAEPFIARCGTYDECDFPATITVPADHYFLLGDNRGSSDDSRFWGAVTKDALYARVDGCSPQPKAGCPRRVAVPAPPPPKPVGRFEKIRNPSISMAPTIEAGDHVVADHRAYERGLPQRGDIVVMHPPASAESNRNCTSEHGDDQMCPRSQTALADVRFIKRIVGVGGDRLAMRHGRLIRNGRPVREPYIADCGGPAIGCDFPRAIRVPPGQYFVLGDNRDASDDSRWWGPVRANAIVARVTRCLPQPKTGCPRRK